MKITLFGIIAALSILAAAADPIHLSVGSASGPIAPDFIGLGYESSAVARSGYFSARDLKLIRLYRGLSDHGLVRIGGNISDHTRYEPEGAAVANPQSLTTVINRAGLEDLHRFLDATGWKAMWGLNLGSGSKEEAAQEAAAVAGILGDRLQSLEIGNEVDLHPEFGGDYRKYFQAYRAYKAAIRAVLPSAAFSGPDVARDAGWSVAFAQSENRDMSLLTQHYYRGHAPQPGSTLLELLGPDPAWSEKLDRLQAASREYGVGYRINEVNSFSGGGRPGVSDTLGAALWCLDYMFQLAAHGAEGINLETDINQFAWVSHYSPIFREGADRLSARPEYYALLAFALAGKGELRNVATSRPDLPTHAYATQAGSSRIWVVVINKDLHRRSQIELDLPDGFGPRGLYRLTGPSAESRTQVTLAGTEVAADGSWSPGPIEWVPAEDGECSFEVPAASAALLLLAR